MSSSKLPAPGFFSRLKAPSAIGTVTKEQS